MPVALPAQVAVQPRLVCIHSGASTLMAKNEPIIIARQIMAMEKPRWRKILRSTMGLASVSSQIRKAMNPTSAVRPRATISGEANQSWSLPRSSMICRQPTHRTISSRPMTSTRALTVFVSWLNSTRHTRKPAPMAIGTLTRKIEPQPKLSHKVPPRTGPAIGPIRVVMAQMAMA